MNTKFSRAIFALACLFGLSIVANAQAQQATPKKVAFTTAPKLVIAKLKSGEADVYDVRGKVSFTITAANSDDTVAGTLVYAIPDDARQKIASMSGKAVGAIPANITRNDIIASFQKATAPPILHLEINAMDIDVVGVKMRFSRIVLDINAREGHPADYSVQEMEALFTVWAKQIANGRSRRGIIARANKVINGEPE
ncbi:MAG: hypothetical protein JST85_19525 [Acidobacteria bacterium]|nr:hypothetical protein [Acidobacteriota bacterium]